MRQKRVVLDPDRRKLIQLYKTDQNHACGSDRLGKESYPELKLAVLVDEGLHRVSQLNDSGDNKCIGQYIES